MGHELGNIEITYYEKLNCSKKEFNLDLQQMIDSLVKFKNFYINI